MFYTKYQYIFKEEAGHANRLRTCQYLNLKRKNALQPKETVRSKAGSLLSNVLIASRVNGIPPPSRSK